MAARYPNTNSSREGTTTPGMGFSCLPGNSKFQSHANYIHCNTAFKWQICRDDSHDWIDLTGQPNDSIEECYCDVNNDIYQGAILDWESGLVTFDTDPMYAYVGSDFHTARRLSTPSIVPETNQEQPFCSEWIWYWCDESNNWVAYSEKNIKGTKAGIDSATIEQKYLDYESNRGAPSIGFTAGNQRYELDFTKMQQRNVQHNTRKSVRRRPKFVSMEEHIKFSQEMFRSPIWNDPCTLPDMKQSPLTDCSSAEYAPIANLFWDTVDDQANIVSIQKLENLGLCEDFLSGFQATPRLSTTSIILKTDQEETFCIEWIWQWCDETNNWTVYFEKNMNGKKRGISSATIEQEYLDYESKQGAPSIGFTAGDQRYELDFTKMQQRNVQHDTCRAVRRRPKFVLMEERTGRSREMLQTQRSGAVIPTTQNNPDTRTDEKHSPLTDCSSAEYAEIANLFWNTMDVQANIVAIQKIENLDLWEDFSRLRERMRKKNMGQPVLQKQLFHGTKEMHCDAICRQNFDWRLSGTNGTQLGKGSYFCHDASFAHNYTKPDSDGCHYVFVAQVLVGDYAKGDSSFVRPPSKDGNPYGELYDSCVDNISNPKKFVIFEKDQIYPEYLIKYNLKC